MIYGLVLLGFCGWGVLLWVLDRSSRPSYEIVYYYRVVCAILGLSCCLLLGKSLAYRDELRQMVTVCR